MTSKATKLAKENVNFFESYIYVFSSLENKNTNFSGTPLWGFPLYISRNTVLARFLSESRTDSGMKSILN